MKKIAAIDIGSQTIRLLIAQHSPTGTFIPIHRDRAIVRLGENMQPDNVLKPQPMARALDCISSFVHCALEHDVTSIHAVATACVRNAANGADFIRSVRHRAGITPGILSGAQEARLGLNGVVSAVSPAGPSCLIIDIGGGSTELTLLNNHSPEGLESLGLGVIGLAEQHLRHDPPLPAEMKTLRQTVHQTLTGKSKIISSLRAQSPCSPALIGTAGTVTTLAAMDLKITDYRPDAINGHRLSLDRLNNLLELMLAAPSRQRALMPGLEEGRSVVIIPGTVTLLTIMELLHIDELLVSDAGLLEGIILDI